MYIKGDFHVHTNASDGKYSPKEIIKLAKSENLPIISITDHDTTKSLEEAIHYGEQYNVKVIPGIELSTVYNDSNVHVLGYFKDKNYNNKELKIFEKGKKECRLERAKKIVKNLYNIHNIHISFDKIVKESKGIISRPHIAKAIIDSGYNYSWEYIFKNLIGSNCKAYVPNKKLTTEDGIKLLEHSGALPVLAHPILIKNINIEKLLKLPFKGIEAVYYMNKKEDTLKFKKLASKYNKIITGGSDFHGITKTDGSHPLKIGATTLDRENINILLQKINSL
ncbi:PHP domain-containing protein [Clostridium niameyense]|uniref:PHP domain-containing protein n=1 Tax=Clostridium niameyense TaxID=1622073 RepID=A0A6M0R845_9CLOT|nr:PHP domain-containing protein [Clostridium niameyense]